MLAVALDVANLAVLQVNANAAAARTHIARGRLDLVGGRDRQGDVGLSGGSQAWPRRTGVERPTAPALVTVRTIRPDRQAAKRFSKPMLSCDLRLLPHTAELAVLPPLRRCAQRAATAVAARRPARARNRKPQPVEIRFIPASRPIAQAAELGSPSAINRPTATAMRPLSSSQPQPSCGRTRRAMLISSPPSTMNIAASKIVSVIMPVRGKNAR